MGFDDIPENRCENPCPADHACADCAEYWKRMVMEGFYDPQSGQWTEKGIKERLK